MIYAVMGYAVFVNNNQRDGAYNDVTTYLTGRQTWGPIELHKTIDESGSPALSLSVRVTAEPEMNEMFTAAQSAMNQRGWVNGQLNWHFCDHDAGNPSGCSIGGEVTP